MVATLLVTRLGLESLWEDDRRAWGLVVKRCEQIRAAYNEALEESE